MSDPIHQVREDVASGRSTTKASRFLDRASAFYREQVPFILIASGAILRLEQFLHRRSLWLDEALLANTAIPIPLSKIGHIPGGQAPPAGFVFVDRLSVSLFGNNEYALRLFPLLCGILSLVVFRSLARRVLTPAAVPIALALFCFSPSLLYFANEFKQYGTDVLFALLIAVGAMRLREGRPITTRRATAYGLVGAASVWFSHPAAFVLAGTAAVLITEQVLKRRWAEARALAVGCVVWGASLAATYLVSLRYLVNDRLLITFWRDGFPPRPLRVGTATTWVLDRAADALRSPAGFFRFPKVAAALGGAGVVASLVRRKVPELAVLLAPIPLVLAAAVARKYPARDRLILFLLPALFLVVAASVDLASVRRLRAVGAAALVILAVVAAEPIGDALRLFPRPIERTEARLLLEYVRDHRQPGDALYVDRGAFPTYRYYALTVGVEADRAVLKRAGPHVPSPDGARRRWLGSAPVARIC